MKGLSVPRSSFLLIVQLVPIYCRRKVLQRQVIKTLNYAYTGYYEESLQIHSFSRAVVFGFPLGPWPIESQILGHPNNVRHGFYILKPHPMVVGTSISFVPFLHLHAMQASHCHR